MEEEEALSGMEILLLDNILRVHNYFAALVNKLRNYNPSVDFSKENRMARKLFGEQKFNEMAARKHNFTVKDFPRIADELERFGKVISSQKMDRLSSIVILNRILRQKKITDRNKLGFEFRKNKDKIFYNMSQKIFESRVTYLREKEILRKRKVEIAQNNMDIRKTKTEEVFFIDENKVQEVCGANLEYIERLCNVVFIPVANEFLKYRKQGAVNKIKKLMYRHNFLNHKDYKIIEELVSFYGERGMELVFERLGYHY